MYNFDIPHCSWLHTTAQKIAQSPWCSTLVKSEPECMFQILGLHTYTGYMLLGAKLHGLKCTSNHVLMSIACWFAQSPDKENRQLKILPQNKSQTDADPQMWQVQWATSLSLYPSLAKEAYIYLCTYLCKHSPKLTILCCHIALESLPLYCSFHKEVQIIQLHIALRACAL